MTQSQNNSIQGAITKFSPGSTREAWSLVFPIILMAASAGLMLFFDRIILAQYSTKAMTAAASAGMVVAVFEYSLVSITAISEVFVGQYNGSGRYKKVGEPVWQMVWLSIASAAIFLPFGLFTAEFFVVDPYDGHGVPYFQWLMYFGPFVPLQAALSGFFLGLGRPKIVTIIAVVGNLINIILDYILVFGIEGWVPSLGTMGAAIATSVALGLQVVVLGYLFLCEKERKKYSTHDFRFKLKPFKKCLRIGFPSAVSHAIELSAWALQLNMMARVSEMHITVMAVGQTMFLLFMFVIEGLNKGISAISSNYMGAGHYEIIPKSFWSTLKIHLIFMAILSVAFIGWPDPLIDSLIEGGFPPEVLQKVIYYSRWALLWVWVFMFVDGVSWIIIGILTAAGDTKFIMVVNSINAWLFGILPLYIWVVLYQGSPASAWFLVALYGVANAVCFIWRYQSGAWKTNKIKE